MLDDLPDYPPPLPESEQLALAARVREQWDVRARDRLVSTSMRLVVALALKRLRKIPASVRRPELSDLVAEGALGLMRAVEMFDGRPGVKFSTYAIYWIDQRLSAAVIDASGNRRSDFKCRQHVDTVLTLEREGLLRAEAVARVAAEGGFHEETVYGWLDRLAANRTMRSLDAPIGDDADGQTLGEAVASGAESAEILLIRKRAVEQVRAAVSRLRLDEREADIVHRRLLVDAGDAATLDELGQTWGVTRERIRQIEAKLRPRFRAAIEELARPRAPKQVRFRAPKQAAPAAPRARPKGSHPHPGTRPRRLCRVCGARMRGHNTRDACHAHGRSASFDARTGRCRTCGDEVPAARRGAHALSHARGGKLSPDEAKRRARVSAAALRADRKATGRCTECGEAPPVRGGARCGECRQASRASHGRWRRAKGVRERTPVTLTCGGETLPLADWSRRTGIDFRVLWSRMKKGWPPERCLLPGRQPKPECVHGHPLTPDNVWVYAKTGQRHCRTCMRDRVQARRAADRERAAA